MRISKTFLIYFIILGSIFQTPYVRYIFNRNCTYFLLVVFAIECIEKIRKHKKVNGLTISFILLEVWILGVTYISHADVYSALISGIRIVTVMLIFENCISRSDIFLSALMLHAELFTYINFISILLFPNGLYVSSSSSYGNLGMWFLGYNNGFIFWLFPALLIAWIYGEYTNKKIRSVVLTACIFITEFYQGSATGKVAVVVFMIIILTPHIRKILTPVRSIIGVVVLVALIVFFRITDFLKFIIVNLLNKNLTFTNRLFIWDNAISAISKKMITGYGILDSTTIINMLGYSETGNVWTGATHAHCNYLQIAFEGGLVAASLFVVIYIIIIRKNIKNWEKKLVQICFYGLIVYSIMGITEVLDTISMFIIFPLAYYAIDLAGKKRGYNTSK